MLLFKFLGCSSKLYFRVVDETEDIDVFQDHRETRSCTREKGESSCYVYLRKVF